MREERGERRELCNISSALSCHGGSQASTSTRSVLGENKLEMYGLVHQVTDLGRHPGLEIERLEARDIPSQPAYLEVWMELI